MFQELIIVGLVVANVFQAIVILSAIKTFNKSMNKVIEDKETI